MGTKKCKMLSFDTSSTCSGWAYWENGKLKEYGKIDQRKEKDKEIRLENMTIELNSVLKKFHPDIVIVEKPPFIKDPSALIILAEITGGIRGWAVDKCEFMEYMPQQWRHLVKDSDEKMPKGRELIKKWDIAKVGELFQITLPAKDDDIADAILIGQARINAFEK